MESLSNRKMACMSLRRSSAYTCSSSTEPGTVTAMPALVVARQHRPRHQPRRRPDLRLHEQQVHAPPFVQTFHILVHYGDEEVVEEGLAVQLLLCGRHQLRLPAGCAGADEDRREWPKFRR